jgi:hypothetical protein
MPGLPKSSAIFDVHGVTSPSGREKIHWHIETTLRNRPILDSCVNVHCLNKAISERRDIVGFLDKSMCLCLPSAHGRQGQISILFYSVKQQRGKIKRRNSYRLQKGETS